MTSTRADTTRAKKRVLMVFLAALAVWPLAQHWLVAAYGMSPWHFVGFSMYCVPRSRLKIDFETHGAPVDAALRKQLGPWALEYAERRQALGELAPPDRLAQAILVVAPDLTSFDIVVTTFYFDVPSASFLKKQRRYPYTR